METYLCKAVGFAQGHEGAGKDHGREMAFKKRKERKKEIERTSCVQSSEKPKRHFLWGS